MTPIQVVFRPLLGLIQISSEAEKRISTGKWTRAPNRSACSLSNRSRKSRKHARELLYGMDHSDVYCGNWWTGLSKNRWKEGMASYLTVHIEYLVAIVDSDGLAPDEPQLEPTDQEDEIGQPQ